jgi:hypothetical protein
VTLACGETAADSILLAAVAPELPTPGTEASSRGRLVMTSLLVGALLLVAILVMHARNRAR